MNFTDIHRLARKRFEMNRSRIVNPFNIIKSHPNNTHFNFNLVPKILKNNNNVERISLNFDANTIRQRLMKNNKARKSGGMPQLERT
eukprot:UN06811